MPLQDSPLWWLFSATAAAIWFAVMIPAMPTRKYKSFVSFGPAAAFAVIALYCLKYEESFTEILPIYCGLVISAPMGILGHRKALREVLADPEVPYGEATGPWTLQFAFALPVFLGLALYYVSR